MIRNIALAAVTSMVTLSSAWAAESAAEVRRAIDEKSRAFEQCYAKRDAACLVNGYYVTDAQGPVTLPPGGQPPVRGRAALIQMFEKEFAGVKAIRLETIEVTAEGKMAHEIGRAHLTLQSGEAVVGRYAVLWLKGADGWRAKVDFIAADGWKD